MGVRGLGVEVVGGVGQPRGSRGRSFSDRVRKPQLPEKHRLWPGSGRKRQKRENRTIKPSERWLEPTETHGGLRANICPTH